MCIKLLEYYLYMHYIMQDMSLDVISEKKGLE